MSVKTVITYGTFDMFHVGHLRLIKRLTEIGDRLIVGVSTDEFNLIKGKKCIIPFEQRKEIVESIRGVDFVIPEDSWEQKRHDVMEYKVDVFVMGEDWRGKFDYLNEYCDVKYLTRTEGISTTELKSILNGPVDNIRKEIDQVFGLIETIRGNLR